MKKLALTMASVAAISFAGILVSGGAEAAKYDCRQDGNSDHWVLVHITNPAPGSHGKIWTCQKVVGNSPTPTYDATRLITLHGK